MKGKGNVQLPVHVLLKARLQCSVEKQFSLGSYLWQEELFSELNQIKSYPFMLNKMNRNMCIYRCRAQKHARARPG